MKKILSVALLLAVLMSLVCLSVASADVDWSKIKEGDLNPLEAGQADQGRIYKIPTCDVDWDDFGAKAYAVCRHATTELQPDGNYFTEHPIEMPAPHTWVKVGVDNLGVDDVHYVHYECSFCGRERWDEEAHKFQWKIIDPPECIGTGKWGLVQKYCPVCGWEGEQEAAEPTDHDWVKTGNVTKATCVNPELTEVECTICGLVDDLVTAPINPEGHEWGDEHVDFPSTCYKPGHAYKVCKLCRIARWEYDLELAPHTFPDDPVEVVTPDCTTSGVAVYICKVCKAEGDSLVLPPRHFWRTILRNEPDADGKGGYWLQECYLCGAQRYLIGEEDSNGYPAEGCPYDHSDKSIWEEVQGRDPQADKPGLTAGQQCKFCKEMIVPQQIIPAKGEAVVKDGDDYIHFVDGKQSDKTGLITVGGHTYYVVKGKVDTSLDGVAKKVNPISGKFYWFTNGVVREDVNQLAEWDGQWFVVENGVINTTYQGTYDYLGGTFIIGAGMKQNYTGLWMDPTDASGKTWYYVVNGQVEKNETGLVRYDGAIFLVKNGKLAVDYTGTWADHNGYVFNIEGGMVVGK